MMSETREFSTAAIASISTGVLLCKFGDMHKAAEYLMGHPIWSHHFASKKLWSKMREEVTKQYPGMPITLPDTASENYQLILSEIEAKFGKTVKIRKGDGGTAMSPTDGIPDGKEIIVI